MACVDNAVLIKMRTKLNWNESKFSLRAPNGPRQMRMRATTLPGNGVEDEDMCCQIHRSFSAHFNVKQALSSSNQGRILSQFILTSVFHWRRVLTTRSFHLKWDFYFYSILVDILKVVAPVTAVIWVGLIMIVNSGYYNNWLMGRS